LKFISNADPFAGLIPHTVGNSEDDISEEGMKRSKIENFCEICRFSFAPSLYKGFCPYFML
jgi:hypothetical protein